MISDVVARLRRSREIEALDLRAGRFEVRYDMAGAFGDDETGDPRVIELVLHPDLMTEYLDALPARVPDLIQGDAAQQREESIRFFCGELVELMDSDLMGTVRTVHLQRSADGTLYPDAARGPAVRVEQALDAQGHHWSAERPRRGPR